MKEPLRFIGRINQQESKESISVTIPRTYLDFIRNEHKDYIERIKIFQPNIP